MKKIIGIIMILAVLILGVYYGMGRLTERTLKKNIAAMNQPSSLMITLKRYDRGWFCSKADLLLQLQIPAREYKNRSGQVTQLPLQNYQVLVPLKILHGPFIYTHAKLHFGLGYAESDLDVSASYAKQFADLFTSDSTKPHLFMSIFVNYLNNSHVTLNLPHFQLVAKKDQSQFDWQGMHSEVELSSGLRHLAGDVKLSGMRFSSGDAVLTLGPVSSDYALDRTKGGLYLGDADVNFPTLLVTQKGQKSFELKQFLIHSNSGIHDGLFSSSLNATLSTLFSDGVTYGPGLLTMAIKNLDADVLVEINNQVNKINQGDSQARQQVMLALLPQIPKLVAKGAEFEVSEMSVTLPGGTIEADLTLVLPEITAGSPFQLIQQAHGEGTFKIPMAVLKDMVKDSIRQHLTTSDPKPAMSLADLDQKAMQLAEQKIDTFVKAGTLSAHGSDYLVSLNLAKGQLMVNGKPFNQAMMGY